MSFQTVLDREYPDAVPEDEYVRDTTQRLGALGFTRQNTLAWVGVCRDEIAQVLVDDVDAAWGPTFSLASLAAMPTAGRTGFTAAAQHAPVIEGPPHVVVYALPHIAIGRTGTIGEVLREGIPHPSTACGALLALRGELESGTISMAGDPLDPEQSYLRQRLVPKIAWGDVPDLVALTAMTADLIEDDYSMLLDEVLRRGAGDDAPASFALFTGVQIHGPDGATYVGRQRAHIVVDGEPVAT